MKVKYITPPGVKDKWTNVPAMRIVPKAGIWTRQRLVRKVKVIGKGLED